MTYVGVGMLKAAAFEKSQQAMAQEYTKSLRPIRQQKYECHDLFFALNAMILNTGLGGRNVVSPYTFLPSQVILDHNLIMDCRKVSRTSHESNISILPKVTIKVIENLFAYHTNSVLAYRRANNIHMSRCAYSLGMRDIGQVQQPIPFMYFIDNLQSTWRTIDGPGIRAVLQDLWPYPIAECRRQLSRGLKLRGVPDYLVETQLHHIRQSFLPFSDQWCQTVFQFRDLLLPELDAYMEDLGWKL